MENPKFVMNYIVFLWIEMVSSVLFTLMLPVFSMDISLLAFPISLVFTVFFVYFGYFKIIKEKNQCKAGVVLKFVQYVPTVLFISFILRRAGEIGTSFAYDLITVLLWIVNFIACIVFQVITNPKRMTKMDDYWVVKAPKKEKRHGLSWVLFEAFDWIDNLLQILVLVMIIQIFTVQLYEIPSESMVPTFLVKDRVLVTKMASGPKFPLTKVGLPVWGKYKRGDIVVLRNPHYSMDRKSEVKTTVSQLVSWLTFMTVNLNVDEHGEMKADPLVKRIAGVAGEQLVMQDGVLYTRTKDSDVFKPINNKEDFGCWNMNTIPKKTLAGVQYIPLSSNEYEMMVTFEEQRRLFDLDLADVRSKLIVDEFKKLSDENISVSFTAPDLNMANLLSNTYEISLKALTQKGGTQWFESFMTDWISSKDKERDMYAESNFRLDVMAKLAFGEMILRNAKLIETNASQAAFSSDEELKTQLNNAKIIYWYVQALLDMRNMPVFPANDSNGHPQYIPENCYFMMGDNRFNSLDLRHRYDEKPEVLTKDDPMSVVYYSMMEPQYISENLIVGKPKYTIWPLNRTGSLHN